jgi:transcriptional regulator with AAA-type ATPase domain
VCRIASRALFRARGVHVAGKRVYGEAGREDPLRGRRAGRRASKGAGEKETENAYDRGVPMLVLSIAAEWWTILARIRPVSTRPERAKGNKSAAARLLGLQRQAFARRLKRYRASSRGGQSR